MAEERAKTGCAVAPSDSSTNPAGNGESKIEIPPAEAEDLLFNSL